jgi:hypothetical protein
MHFGELQHLSRDHPSVRLIAHKLVPATRQLSYLQRVGAPPATDYPMAAVVIL